MKQDALVYRDSVRHSDLPAVKEIVVSTGFFNDSEVDVAVELVLERLLRGLASGYHFLFAERAHTVVGYTCFGPIAATVSSFDLYWIAVHNGQRGSGIGGKLLAETERRAVGMGARRIYAETSSRELYEPTRRFYEACGYRVEATLKDFYAPGDSKVIFSKTLPSPSASPPASES